MSDEVQGAEGMTTYIHYGSDHFIRSSSSRSETVTGGRRARMELVCGHHGLMMDSAGKPGAGRITSIWIGCSGLANAGRSEGNLC